MWFLSQAMKQGAEVQELLTWKPWASDLADISTEMTRTPEQDPPTDAVPSRPQAPAQAGAEASATTQPSWHQSVEAVLPDITDGDTREEVSRAADRICRRLVSLCVDIESQTLVPQCQPELTYHCVNRCHLSFDCPCHSRCCFVKLP